MPQARITGELESTASGLQFDRSRMGRAVVCGMDGEICLCMISFALTRARHASTQLLYNRARSRWWYT